MSYQDKLIKNIENADKDKTFTGSHQYVVDFASGDPIKDVQAIKADSPVFLTKVITTNKNNYKLEKAGTIVPKTEKAAQALKDCFLKDGKLANTNSLSIDKDCILDINDDNLPHDLNLGDGARLVIDKGAQIHNASLYDSDIHLAAGSEVKDTSLEKTNTGKASYDKDNKLHFDKGPAKVQISNESHKLYISSLRNTNLDNNCKFDTVAIANATLANSNLTDFVYDGANFVSKDFKFKDSPRDLLVVANTTARDARVILTNAKAEPVKTTLTNSNLKRTVITRDKNSIDVCDSDVEDSILLDDYQRDDDSQDTMINSSKIKGVIMRKPLVADNSSVLAKKSKPIVAFGALDLNDAHLQPKEDTIIATGKSYYSHISDDLSDSNFRPTNNHYKELCDLNKVPVSRGLDKSTDTVALSEKYLLGHEAYTNNTIVDDEAAENGQVRKVSEIVDTIDKATSTIDSYAKEHAEDAAKTAKWAKETGVEL